MKIITVNFRIKFYRFKFIRKIAENIILLLGAHILFNVSIGKNVNFAHNAISSVIHNSTVIKDNVIIFQNITIGKANPFMMDYQGVTIEEGAIISAGAKILFKSNPIRIGKYAIVAANAVLTNSIDDNEI